MSDSLWFYATLLLLGYALGATMIRGGRSEPIVFTATDASDYGGKGCSSIIVLVLAGLLLVFLLNVTTGDF